MSESFSASVASVQSKSASGHDGFPGRGRDRLGRRLVVLTMVALTFGLAMVGGTLWLSWALEGAAAAINDAGSMRMQSTRLALVLERENANRIRIASLVDELDRTLSDLRHGVPIRPLRLPATDEVNERLLGVERIWQDQLRPAATEYASGFISRTQATQAYAMALPAFVEQTDQLVNLVEVRNAQDTFWLRASQFGLIALMLGGAVAIIFFLYAWVIRPIEALRRGVTQMTARNFAHRVPVESLDEIGELAMGFNDMAAQLREGYDDLETRVQEKTDQYARQNRELSTLYEFSAYLGRSDGDIHRKSEGFLSRAMAYFSADAGTVRIFEPKTRNLHITAHQGLSPELIEEERCMHVNDCLCGDGIHANEARIHDFRDPANATAFMTPCQKEGFGALAVGQIRYANQQLGVLTLHFQVPRVFSDDDRRLLDTLGRHFGVAIENRRLLDRTRELAIAEERNLMAQGLHDSIAQGLSFLKLQVRMLRDLLEPTGNEEVDQILGLLEVGIRESYDDVRELLTNFRVKVTNGGITLALKEAAHRFEHQTGIGVNLDFHDHGAPLSAEQQLQVFFVVQEALSNVRKHAHANEVTLTLRNENDFSVTVQDDGLGFDIDGLDEYGEDHVGLKIMRERAKRLGAHLSVVCEPERGTRVSLVLPHERRGVT